MYSDTQEKIEALKNFANDLKANGFTVIVSETHPFEWLHFYKDGQFGYVEKAYFSGYNFGTVHKPCAEHGTGISTGRETDLTIENAKKALHIPGWVNNRSNIKPYNDPEEFIKSHNNTWSKYYIL